MAWENMKKKLSHQLLSEDFDSCNMSSTGTSSVFIDLLSSHDILNVRHTLDEAVMCNKVG